MIMGNCNSCFVLFSMFSSAAACAGFFLPYWLKGLLRNPNTVPTFFGTFRRCYFPQLSADETELIIVKECGRYNSFMDIPSVSWQLTTLIVGFGAALSLFSAVISFLACWMESMWNRMFIRTLGFIHLTAGLLITTGLCIYPLGWDHREVRGACGDSDKYKLGTCRIYWCYFILIAAGTTELLLFLSSIRLSASPSSPVRQPYNSHPEYPEFDQQV